MKALTVCFIHTTVPMDTQGIHAVLDQEERHPLNFHLWRKEKGSRPEVRFSIAHNNHTIFLKFFVQEAEFRARVMKTNGPVWEDSCVEFFISLDGGGYYNLECNAVGTILAAFGKSRNERRFLPEDVLRDIEVHTNFRRTKEHFVWEMLLAIPVGTFVHHRLTALSGMTCRGNFYKCGDGLAQPHYLSWNDIETRVPDFHVPQFFGKIVFE